MTIDVNFVEFFYFKSEYGADICFIGQISAAEISVDEIRSGAGIVQENANSIAHAAENFTSHRPSQDEETERELQSDAPYHLSPAVLF